MIRSLVTIVEALFFSCHEKRMVQVAIRLACSRNADAVSPPIDRPMRPIHSRIERPRLTSRLLVTTAWV